MNISVFITSYNQCGYLREAIESVLAQTQPASQIIIVDDASLDDSPDLIADYVRRYPNLITAIYHKHNTGVAQVRINALKAVRGDYVTYVDGDDWFLPQKLEKESLALKNTPDVQIAFSNNDYMTEDGTEKVSRWVDGEPVPQGNVFFQTLGRNFPKRSLFRMELVDYKAWQDIGFHDPALALYEDFDMRIRLAKRLKVVYVDLVLSHIRTHSKGLSKSSHSYHFAALDYLFNKHKRQLGKLPDYQYHQALAALAGWIAPMGFKAAKKAVRKGHLVEALRLGLAAVRYRNLSIQ
ncbi:MAG: glycosyltransferase family 2 protein [Candidatus Electrothrix sp. AR3]|nr:glycosyltransferase family 2 protein [Candidatus Electrothrix sp. AR3]